MNMASDFFSQIVLDREQLIYENILKFALISVLSSSSDCATKICFETHKYGVKN